MEYLHKALSAVKQKIHRKDLSCVDTHSSEEERELPLILDERQHIEHDEQKGAMSTDDLIDCLTTPEVIDLLTVQMLTKFGISHTSNLPLESLGVKQCSQLKRTLPLSTDSDQGSGQLCKPSDEWKIKNHPPCKRRHDEDENKLQC